MMKRNLTINIQKKGKKDKLTGIPCTIDISAIGHGFAGTPKCLVVNTSHCKYVKFCTMWCVHVKVIAITSLEFVKNDHIIEKYLKDHLNSQ